MDTEFLDCAWQDIDMPAKDVIQRIAEIRKNQETTPLSETLELEALPLTQFNASMLVDMSAALQRFQSRLERIQKRHGDQVSLAEHPWHGVRNTKLKKEELAYIPAALEVWQKSLVDLGRHVFGFAKTHGLAELARQPLPKLWALSKTLSELPPLTGHELWDYLEQLQGETLTHASQCIASLEQLLDQEDTLKELVLPWELFDTEAAHRHVKGGMLMRETLAADASLAQVKQALGEIPALLEQLEAVKPLLQEVHEALQPPETLPFDVSLAGLGRLEIALDCATHLPQRYWSLRDPVLESDDFDGVLDTLKQLLTPLRALEADLEAYFFLPQLPAIEEVRRLQHALAGGGKLKWMDREWRADKDALYAFATDSEIPLEELLQRLPRVVDYLEQAQAIDSNTELGARLGPVYSGRETDLHAASSLRNWYRNVRQRCAELDCAALADLLIGMDADVASRLNQINREHRSNLTAMMAQVRSLNQIISPTHPLQQAGAPLLALNDGLNEFAQTCRQALDLIKTMCEDDRRTISELHALIETHRRLNRDRSSWQRHRKEHRLFPTLSLGLQGETGTDDLERAKVTLTLARAIEALGAGSTTSLVRHKACPLWHHELIAFSERMQELLEKERQHRASFRDLARLDIRAWLPEKHSIKAIHDRNRTALANEDQLSEWLDLVRASEQASTAGLGALSRALMARQLPSEDAQLALKASVYDALLAASAGATR